MGEAKRRKKLNPNYGKKSTSSQSVWDFYQAEIQKEENQLNKKLILFACEGMPFEMCCPENDSDKALIESCDFSTEAIVTVPIDENTYRKAMFSGKGKTVSEMPFITTTIPKEKLEKKPVATVTNAQFREKILRT